MKHPTLHALFSLGFGFAVSTCAAAGALPQPSAISGRVATTYEVHAGSPDYRLLQEWVAAATARSGTRVGDSSNLFQKSIGDVFRVEVSRNIQPSSTNVIAAALPGAPIPPWDSGEAYRMGDVATVNVTGGGWTQSWNLRCEQTVQGLAWVTVDYHAARMNANKPLVGH